MMRSDSSKSGPQGGKGRPTPLTPATPNVATALPAGTVEAQHQMTGQPYVPGAVPTKPAPGAR